MKKGFLLLTTALQIFIGKSSLMGILDADVSGEIIREKETLCFFEIYSGDLEEESVSEKNNESFCDNNGLNSENDVVEEKTSRSFYKIYSDGRKKNNDCGNHGNLNSKNYVIVEKNSGSFYEIYGKKDNNSLQIVCDIQRSEAAWIDDKESLSFFELLERD